MLSIMESYKEYVKEMKDEQRNYTSECLKSEYVYEKREDLMLKGQNRRSTYSLERVCLSK